jgi:putative Mg2+ transporter-C (MgtC) family protein
VTTHLELIGRIVLGSVFGGVIGLERNLHSRHVVLRTHVLVSMASAAFMVVSANLAYLLPPSSADTLEVDASRIAASVVSGIGFLAGGVILKSGTSVQGLTTASSLWLATAVGLLAGAGMPIESGAVAALGIGSLAFLRRFEDKKEPYVHRRVTLVLGAEDDALPLLLGTLGHDGVRVSAFDYERQLDDSRLVVKFEAHIPASIGVDAFIRRAEHVPGIRQIRVKATG